MVHDFSMYQGDISFIKSMLPSVRSVLNHFAGHQISDCSLEFLPYWNFTDWAVDNSWNAGVPRITPEENIAIHDLLILLAYQSAY